jgi:lipoprotein-releasing system ATP-binding protein
MLEARALHKIYHSQGAPLEVLRGVGVTIADGEFLAITGPSGAGKSTLLHLLAGLDKPTQGEVFWQSRSLTAMNDEERAKWRNRSIGVVFQFYHLVPELSAVENVMLPGLVDGRRPPREVRERALARLDQVGLSPRAAHKPSQLSGGELQRVAIARALINEPRVVFCDEPTGNLDSHTGQAVADLLVRLHQEQRMTLVLVTHAQALAELADRRLALRDGQIESESKSTKRLGSGS